MRIDTESVEQRDHLVSVEQHFESYLTRNEYRITHVLVRRDIKIPDLHLFCEKLRKLKIEVVLVPSNYEPQMDDLTPSQQQKLLLHYIWRGFIK